MKNFVFYNLLVFAAGLCMFSNNLLASNPDSYHEASELLPVSDLPLISELPDLFTMNDGSKITSVSDWENFRRPELKKLFQHYMYGYLPPEPDNPQYSTEIVEKDKFDGKATLRIITIKPDDDLPNFSMMVLLPNQSEKKYPVFIGLNFVGNHTVADFPEIPLPEVWVNPGWTGSEEPIACDSQRGIRSNRWPLEMIIDRGFGVATIYAGEISPDYSQMREYNGCVDGIHRNLLTSNGCRPVGTELGQIAAWAWGLQRGVDFLVGFDLVDSDRIIAIGHSRLGKAALLAGAFDQRISIVIPSQAGSGATSPSRFNIGESVEDLNNRFPLWFNELFKEFNDQVERLPFDQHSLIAMVAPRPLLLTNATNDQWADPVGQFNMLIEASKVYHLYGFEGLGVASFPEENTLIDSRLGYFIRPGSHSMTKIEWNTWMDFCDKHFD